jgi:hypothetical protein
LTSQLSASQRERTNLLWALPLIAAVLMAHQIGGKAARDGFFLSNWLSGQPEGVGWTKPNPRDNPLAYAGFSAW